MKVSMCENNLCIYWENYKCTCKQITINEMGLCSEIILVRFDEKILKKLRKESLNRLEENYY